MHRSCVIVALALSLSSTAFAADEVRWQRIPVEDIFRSEGVAAGDVNKDGKMDVMTGDIWFEAPDWKPHEIRKPGTFNAAAGYSQSFADWAYDVNRDGWVDLIVVGFPGAPFHWYENPQNKEGHWKEHVIWHSACNETPQFLDVTGDGQPEMIVGSNPEGQMGYLEIPAGDKVYEKWTFTPVSTEKSVGTDKFYHGLGVGDVNRDGRLDILIPHGWWEQPEKRNEGPWKFRAWSLSADGKGGSFPAADLYADDLDGDGDSDIMMSSAHGVGIWWFESVGTIDQPQFKMHLISDAFSQTHALNYVDINGDGTKDLVTGKRFYAHGPNGDVDPMAEVVMYWFEVQKGSEPKFIAHKIEEGSGTGVGTQFQVTDFNGDRKPDIILSNKKGTNVLLQK